MVSYFRTTKNGYKMAVAALDGIPVMIFKSIRSKYIFHYYTEAEKIIYNLDPDEWCNETKLPDTSHVVVIPSVYLQDAQIKEMLTGIVMPWLHIKQQGLDRKQWYYNDCYAYESNNGDIFFKLPGLKKQFKFLKSLL